MDKPIFMAIYEFAVRCEGGVAEITLAPAIYGRLLDEALPLMTHPTIVGTEDLFVCGIRIRKEAIDGPLA